MRWRGLDASDSGYVQLRAFLNNTMNKRSRVSGFRGGVLGAFAFLGCCEAYNCSYLLTLQDNILCCQTQRSCSFLGPPV
jgi:hypothetical protein